MNFQTEESQKWFNTKLEINSVVHNIFVDVIFAKDQSAWIGRGGLEEEEEDVGCIQQIGSFIYHSALIIRITFFWHNIDPIPA